MKVDYTIFNGYLIFSSSEGYLVTDECQFNEIYATYDECIKRILELEG